MRMYRIYSSDASYCAVRCVATTNHLRVWETNSKRKKNYIRESFIVNKVIRCFSLFFCDQNSQKRKKAADEKLTERRLCECAFYFCFDFFFLHTLGARRGEKAKVLTKKNSAIGACLYQLHTFFSLFASSAIKPEKSEKKSSMTNTERKKTIETQRASEEKQNKNFFWVIFFCFMVFCWFTVFFLLCSWTWTKKLNQNKTERQHKKSDLESTKSVFGVDHTYISAQ